MKPLQFGQAFGQLLAYDAVISQDGYEFIKEFFNKLANREHDPIPYEVSSRISDQPSVTVYRFVALTDRACANYTLIQSLREKLTRPIGVIRYDRRCKLYLRHEGNKDSDICKSEPIKIGITKHYERQDFLREISDRIRRVHPNLTPSYSPRTNPRMLQLRLGHSGFHLEVRASKKVATLSLDVELGRRASDKCRKDKLFISTRRTMNRLKHQIEGLKIQRNWTNRKRWGRIGSTLRTQTSTMIS